MPTQPMCAMKQFIVKAARWLLSPWRHARQRRYAEAPAAAQTMRELPNHQFLPVVAKAIAEGHTATIAVKGYSMRPFLEHMRDKVLLEPAPPDSLRVGDAVLAEIEPGHFVLHRIIGIADGEVTLMGDGNLRGTEHCSADKVCGRVRQYIRPNGHILQASDPRLRRQIKLWRRLLPIRRYLLFIYKATI